MLNDQNKMRSFRLIRFRNKNEREKVESHKLNNENFTFHFPKKKNVIEDA